MSSLNAETGQIIETRERLLAAAGEVFAEFGFQGATVRDICTRAGANLAAVNYYFRDKETLYAEVIRNTHQECLDKFPPDFELPPNPTAKDRLHAFIRSYLLRLFASGKPAWFSQLLSRECSEPSPALDMFVSEFIRPRAQLLFTIIRSLLGEPLEHDLVLVRRCGHSVMGQILHYHFARHVLQRLGDHADRAEENVDSIADHITRFSVSAIESIRTSAAGSGE